MTQGEFEAAERAKAIGLSHSDWLCCSGPRQHRWKGVSGHGSSSRSVHLARGVVFRNVVRRAAGAPARWAVRLHAESPDGILAMQLIRIARGCTPNTSTDAFGATTKTASISRAIR